MNLFDIQKRIDDILDYACENEGDLGESGAEELAIAEEELQDKLYAYSFIIDKYESDISLLKQYKKALDDRIKRSENKIKRLKDIIAEVVYKYGEDVLKKNPDTGIKEPTGSKSLKYPNISISVRKGQDIITDDTMFTTFADTIKNYIDNPNKDNKFPGYQAAKQFINIKLDTYMNIAFATEIKRILKENGISFDIKDFKVFVDNTNLKKILNQNPEGLDAWELEDKDIVTIRK